MRKFLSSRSYSLIVKYHDKLLKAAKVKGFDSIEAVLSAQKQIKASSSMSNHTLNHKEKSMITNENAIKKLDQILNLAKIKDLDSSSISEIWNSYLSEKGSLSATISGQTWAKQVLNLTKYPTFLLTLPLDESFQFYFMEFSKNSIHLTDLLNYQTRGSLAKPNLQIHFYTDLVSDKDLVLMKADILDSTFDIKNAQYLIYQIQYWYYIGQESTLDIIRNFHSDPKNFDYKWITEYDYFKKC